MAISDLDISLYVSDLCFVCRFRLRRELRLLFRIMSKSRVLFSGVFSLIQIFWTEAIALVLFDLLSCSIFEFDDIVLR